MIQCIIKKSTNEFITAAIRFGRHLIDAGDNFFFDANRKNFVSIITLCSFGLDNKLLF